MEVNSAVDGWNQWRCTAVQGKAGKVEQFGIGQLGWLYVANGRENGFQPSRMLPVPALQHFLDDLPLQVVLGTAQVAGNDGKLLQDGVAGQICFTAIGHGTDHNVALVATQQLRRHGLELAAIEHVEKQGFDNVVAMVAERNLGGADLFGEPVERAATQPRAQTAVGAPFRHQVGDDAVSVLLEDVI